MFAATLLKLFPPPRQLQLAGLGLDLSDRSIKYCSLERRGGGLKLRSWGERELPAGAIIGGAIRDPAPVRAILRDLAQTTGENLVTVALPEEPSYVVRLTLPAVKRSELRQSLELQLEEHVPIAIEEAVFDYDVLREPEGLKGTYELAVTVLPAATVRAYQDLFLETGLRPLAFEVEAQALARVLGARSAEPVALLDFGRLHTGLVVAAAGRVLRTSTFGELGGELLTRALHKGLGVDPAMAERLKKEQGILENHDQRVVFALLPTLSVLRDEISKFITAWNTSETRQPVHKLFLAGGQAALPGLVEYLAAGLPVTVALGEVWSALGGPGRELPPLPAATAAGYAVAIGLALRSFTFEHE